MHARRRAFLRHATTDLAGGLSATLIPRALARVAGAGFDVRSFGAVGDGQNIDLPAFNQAIAAAAASGGGTVRVPAGTYAFHSIVADTALDSVARAALP